LSFELPDPEHVETLKKSVMQVGFLSETLVDENNLSDILSGKHRKVSYSNWPERKVKVKSPLHRELIILHSNVQRQVPEDTTKQRLLRIARIMSTTGGIVTGLNGDRTIQPCVKEDVSAKMADLVPYTEQWIRHCLPDEYKHIEKRHKTVDEKLLSQVSSTTPLTPTEKSLLAVFEQKPKSVESVTTETEALNLTQITLPAPSCKCPSCDNYRHCYG
jgi:hypothetical protein